jgi:hypothetical protein
MYGDGEKKRRGRGRGGKKQRVVLKDMGRSML